MSIGLFCSICKKSSKLGSKKCNCGNNFKNNRKYRVRYKMPNGKWKSRIVDTLDLARSLEGQYRTDKIKEKDFGIHKAPKIEDVWKKYIAWAKVNKRSWRDDKARWEMHVAQHVKKVSFRQARVESVIKSDSIGYLLKQRRITDDATKLFSTGNGFACATCSAY